jgi:hypothetical protein
VKYGLVGGMSLGETQLEVAEVWKGEVIEEAMQMRCARWGVRWYVFLEGESYEW